MFALLDKVIWFKIYNGTGTQKLGNRKMGKREETIDGSEEGGGVELGLGGKSGGLVVCENDTLKVERADSYINLVAIHLSLSFMSILPLSRKRQENSQKFEMVSKRKEKSRV